MLPPRHFERRRTPIEPDGEHLSDLRKRGTILGFIAGFLAVLIFHQSLWYLLNLVGLIPLGRPAWPLDPIPPYDVLSVISKAFWGGLSPMIAPCFCL